MLVMWRLKNTMLLNCICFSHYSETFIIQILRFGLHVYSMHTLIGNLDYLNSWLSKYFFLAPASLANQGCTIIHVCLKSCVFISCFKLMCVQNVKGRVCIYQLKCLKCNSVDHSNSFLAMYPWRWGLNFGGRGNLQHFFSEGKLA